MPIAFLSGTEFRGEVGQPLGEDLVVQVMDATGQPVKGKVVTFTCEPRGALTLGTERHATDTTKDDGTARIAVTVRRFGPNTIRASVAGTTKAEHAECTVNGFHPQVEVRDVNGNVVVLRRRDPPPAPPLTRWWAIATAVMVVVALAVAGLLGLKALSGKGGTGPTPGPVNPPVVSGVDNTARAGVSRVERDLRRVEGETRGELAHRPARHEVEGYVEGRVENAERWGFGAANTVVGHIRNPDAHDGECTSPACITACRIDPDLPACRRR